ncbi:hypothetical protein Csa_015710 [Cucumis sativus]|nr:hypothetical protein Csa_015710 [Cucumis sativus]
MRRLSVHLKLLLVQICEAATILSFPFTEAETQSSSFFPFRSSANHHHRPNLLVLPSPLHYSPEVILHPGCEAATLLLCVVPSTSARTTTEPFVPP